MVDSTPWVGLASLGLLTVFSALDLAMRMTSRAGLAVQFEQSGRGDAFSRFAATRGRSLLATAVVRTSLTLTLFLIALSLSEPASGSASLWGRVVACLAVLVLVLVFGVAIPNAWATYGGASLIVRTLPLLSAARMLCFPMIVFLQVFDPLVRRLAGVPVRNAESYADELEREILDAVSEGERHGAVDKEEKEMIESVIELSETHVNEIMTPRTEMVALAKEADLETVLALVRLKGHSRIPVYEGTIDTILGVLYAKDLLQRENGTPFSLPGIMRKVLFIPESKLVRELLREFQDQKVHIAVVLDEYGGTAGLVTIEDILEELVGEIIDEYDPTAPAELERIDDRTVEVDARMRIDDLNDQLRLELPEDQDFETIGGFVFSKLGKVPEVGERCSHGRVVMLVIGAELRRVTRLRLDITSVEERSHASE